MTFRSTTLASLAAGVGLAGAVLGAAPTAWAAGNSGSATGIFIDFGGTFPGTVPASCPPELSTDDLGLFFVSGNTNSSDGNGTVEGDAYYVALPTDAPPIVLAFGRATKWGNDKAFSVVFDGVSSSGQTIAFHMEGDPLSLQHVDTVQCS